MRQGQQRAPWRGAGGVVDVHCRGAQSFDLSGKPPCRPRGGGLGDGKGFEKTELAAGLCLGLYGVSLCARRAFADFRFQRFHRHCLPAMGLILLPLVLPEIIIAVALLVMLMRLGLSLSLWTVIVGHVLVCVPFSIAVLNSAFSGLDQSLEEASFDLGETAWGTFRRVTFPLILPGVISSLLITFTISLDEFIIAFFLTGTDVTLPVYIWSQLRFPAKLPGVMALGTLLLLLTISLLVIAEFFRRRTAQRRGLDASTTEGLI
ncbi:MAG: ABC transporter permease [Rhodobacteraceae bacterium]|nr:ABC transporter permease [Paracoccaceae bacterium]